MQPSDVTEILEQHWGWAPDSAMALRGGMNSWAWRVERGPESFVIKAVPEVNHAAFQAGLRAATIVDNAGIRTGRPIPNGDGALWSVSRGFSVALMAWVAGRPLASTDEDATLIGRTLGQAHRALENAEPADAPKLDWINPSADHVSVRPWIRPTLNTVLDEWRSAQPSLRSWSLLHGDPAPEAFLRAVEEDCALIDWASCFFGPTIYDLASASMYVGPDLTDTLVAAYIATGASTADEISSTIDAALRLRWAAQADYFARRLHVNDLTGIASQADNEKGLEDARINLL